MFSLRVIIELLWHDFYIFTNNCKTVIKSIKIIHSKGVEGVGLSKAYIFCLIDFILLLKCGEGGNVQGGRGQTFGLFKCTYFMDGLLLELINLQHKLSKMLKWLEFS